MKKRPDTNYADATSNSGKGDFSLFKQAFDDVRPIKQDKIPPPPPASKQKTSFIDKNHRLTAEIRQAAASFHFSDGFEAHFETGPRKYVRPGKPTHEIKRLRRGEYPPDLILDLHGYKKDEAKLEIAALIQAAQKHHHHCVCIVHGVGTGVLRNSVPNWLVQHPAVEGFHQAPLEWGGNGALLVLIEQPKENQKYD